MKNSVQEVLGGPTAQRVTSNSPYRLHFFSHIHSLITQRKSKFKS